MKKAWIVFKRELSAYFVSPIAYVVLAMFIIITGILFYSNVVWYADASFRMMQNPYFATSLNLTEDFIRPMFANLSVLLLFVVPALTMRTFAEEKRNGTIELLLSYPITDNHVIWGKFLATVAFFSIMLLVTLYYPGYLFFIGSPEIGPLITAYAGFFLLGILFISAGLFTSTLTENQIIAALLAFGFNLTFWVIGWIGGSDAGIMKEVLSYLSIIEHYDPMTRGILNSKNIVYFLSLTTLFLFLTNRSLLSKNWRS